MSNIISSGQITIIDLYDAPALNAWIGASQTTTQTYDDTTEAWSPNFVSSPQVLTLNLTKAGSSGSLLEENVSNIRWYKTIGNQRTEITDTTDTFPEYKSGSSHSVLTSKQNVDETHNAAVYTAEGTWTDKNTGLDVEFSASITLTVVHLAKASVIGNISAPDGDFFRNDTPSSLKIEAQLFKDGALSNGSKKFKWFAKDTSVGSSEDTDAGAGWRKIEAITGSSGEVASSGFDVAVTGQGVLTVYPDAVVNAQTYMAIITDNAGGTSGTKVKLHFTVRDMDDPIMVIVESTGGNILKNGIGSTELKARLYQMGEEIDQSGSRYTYRWTSWTDNNIDPNFGGVGNAFKTGKTLTVGNKDVHSKTTFRVEVKK